MMLTCSIIDIGMPPGKFYWERPDKRVINRDVITNDTHTVLILTNLTRSDSGEYRCVADGPLSLERYSMYLRLQGQILNNSTILKLAINEVCIYYSNIHHVI